MYDPDHTELFNDFPELMDDGVMFSKEVLAHFGLLFSAYADLEASLQHCYIMWQLSLGLKAGEIANQDQWASRFDELERRSFAATFGTLLRLLEDLEALWPFMKELTGLKRKRDYFAHHFFREENCKLHSLEALLFLMSKMNELRKNVILMQEKTDRIHLTILKALYPNRDWDKEIARDVEALKGEYQLNPQFRVGWEEY